MNTISVVINTLNEEENILECMKSVKSIADEIVVCDMHSEDRTIEIARENGAVIAYHEKIRHVGPARYGAVLNASCEWVLLIDADERMTENLAAKLREIVAEDKVDVVCFGILYNYFGKVIKHGGFFSNNFPRFFRKKTYLETYDRRDGVPHHDGCNLMEKVKNRIRLPRAYFIEHYPYPSVNSYVDKTVGWYSIVEAETMFDNGERFRLYKLILQPIKTFIASYILRAGFLDGIAGFVLAMLYSAHRFSVWANLWWLEKNKKYHVMDINSFSGNIKKRIKLTISCSDCGYIPKHDKAGQIEYDGKMGKEIQYMFNGLKIVKGCYEGDWMTYIINRLKGHHEPQEEKVFYEVLRKIPRSDDNVIMELGAAWSYYSMWFIKDRGGKAILVEPNPERLNTGLTNFNINNLSCVSVAGFIGSFYRERDTFIDWDSRRIAAPRYTVDYLMEYFNITKRVTILHSDIQGAEYEMLQGAGESLKTNKIDYIFISTHNRHEQCLDILHRYNYRIIASHSIKESASGDGLIAASSPLMEKLSIEISKI